MAAGIDQRSRFSRPTRQSSAAEACTRLDEVREKAQSYDVRCACRGTGTTPRNFPTHRPQTQYHPLPLPFHPLQVLGIDEGQFFPDIVSFCEDMANAGKLVIVAALDGTFQRKVGPGLGPCADHGYVRLQSQARGLISFDPHPLRPLAISWSLSLLPKAWSSCTLFA